MEREFDRCKYNFSTMFSKLKSSLKTFFYIFATKRPPINQCDVYLVLYPFMI